jgi:hypothetical protein
MRPEMLLILLAEIRSMADRKAELERKKAKLQALREEKERRRMEKAQKDVNIILHYLKFEIRSMR